MGMKGEKSNLTIEKHANKGINQFKKFYNGLADPMVIGIP